ncbi:hypothetical protein XELAEV_18003867mg [Xenopus laevis]|uniref:Uncharacterized protein n=1 Tax=Xenopus laevis TaxID=8355 RepID=A0A974BNB7_XENLA|nr:hypothetical protein XELAEV_18003867mg [Xenopus laevis]
MEDGIVYNGPSVGKSLRNLIEKPGEVDAWERFKVFRNLSFCVWARQSLLPCLRVFFWAVTVFMIDWT